MNTPKVVSTFIFNPIPLATQIETVAGRYLQQSEKGVYLLGATEPVMVPGKQYYQITLDSFGRSTQTAITPTTPIIGNIVDAEGSAVLSKRRLSLLRDGSQIPIQGLKIVSSMVDYILASNSEWGEKPFLSLDEMIGEFILTEEEFYKSQFNLSYQYHHWAMEGIILIQQILHQLEPMIENFIGTKEDDRWVMHFVEQVNRTDIAIIKSIDFRIYDWTRRMKGLKK